MRITFRNGIYVAIATYEEREALKEAGFFWHPGLDQCERGPASCAACRAGLKAGWWTRKAASAARLSAYADDFAKKELATHLKAVELSRSTASDMEIPAPRGFDYLPYQKAGIQYMSQREGTLLGDEPGLGKTIQILGLINHDTSIKNVLVICPAALRINWKREAERWLIPDERRWLLYSASEDRVVPTQANFVIANYERCRIGFKRCKGPCEGKRREPIPCPRCKGTGDGPRHPLLCDLCLGKKTIFCPKCKGKGRTPETNLKIVKSLFDRKWDLVAIDEAHFLKTPDSQRTRAVLGDREKKKLGLADLGRIRVFMTGTPIPNRPIEIWPILASLAPAEFGNFRGFAKRFCTEKDTPLWMADLSFKPIGQAKEGDRIIGWTNQQRKYRPSLKSRETLVPAIVEKVFRRKAECIQVTMQSGRKVVCTPDHLWSRYTKTSGVKAATSKSGPKKYDYPFTTPEIGRTLSHVIDPVYPCSLDDEYKLGYLWGSIQGDGSLRCKLSPTGGIVTVETSLRVWSRVYAQRFKTFAEELGFEVSDRPIGSEGHRIAILGGKRTYEKFHSLDINENSSVSFVRGFLGGIYDSEGHGTTIAQYEEKNPDVYSLIEKALRNLGFSYGSSPKVIRIHGGRKEILRFWYECRPCQIYKIENHVFQGRFRHPDQIVNIEYVGEREVVGLRTSTGNYIAGGFASKNCDGHEEYVSQTKKVFKFDGASNLEELQERLRATCMIRRLKMDVLKDLPPKRRQIIPIPPTEEAKKLIAQELEEWDRRFGEDLTMVQETLSIAHESQDRVAYASAVDKLQYIQRVAFVEMAAVRKKVAIVKIPSVVEHIKSMREEGVRKIIVFAHHHEVIETLHEKFKDISVTAYGKTTAKAKDEAVQAFQDPKSKIDIFIGGITAVGVGITLTASSNVVFAEPDWTPGAMEQAEDRAHRIGQQNSVLIQQLVLDGSLDARMVQLIMEKKEIAERALDRSTDVVVKGLLPPRPEAPPDPIELWKKILLKEALVILAKRRDLETEGGHGFSQFDASLGQKLATKRGELSDREAHLGLKLVSRYRRQVPSEILKRLGIEEPAPKKGSKHNPNQQRFRFPQEEESAITILERLS